MALKALAPEQAAKYSSAGYCVFPGLLDANQVHHIKGVYARAAQEAREGWHGWALDNTAWDGKEGSERFLRRVPAPFYNDEGFRQIFSAPHVLDCVEDLIGPEIYLHSSMMLFKLAEVGRRMPPHQDQAYWDDLTAQQVTLWCAMDRATPENGCVQIIPGSHRHGLIPHKDVNDIWILPEFEQSEMDQIIMSPGDGLFIHPLVVHTSGANVAKENRLAAIVRFYSAPKHESQRSKYGSTTPLRSGRSSV